MQRLPLQRANLSFCGIGAKGNERQRHSVPCTPRDLLVGEDLDPT